MNIRSHNEVRHIDVTRPQGNNKVWIVTAQVGNRDTRETLKRCDTFLEASLFCDRVCAHASGLKYDGEVFTAVDNIVRARLGA
jgi:hypothetical protein